VPHGWIILDKPLGLGSTQAVGAVKRNLREGGHARVKVGHGGTLDPLASGVLPIALGEATKLAGRMLDASKTYEFTIAFGVETDTLDLEGKVVAQSDVRPTRAQVAAMLPRFTGPIEQVPPAYSALMIDGERAYDRARAGEDVVLASRRVTVESLHIGHAELVSASIGKFSPASLETQWTLKQVQGDEQLSAVTLEAHVSKGTYIRSLARDLARALASCGHVTHLRRTRAGPFGLDKAISLDKLNEIGKGAPLEPILLPLKAALVDIPELILSPEQARAVRQGRVLTGMSRKDGQALALLEGIPVALMEVTGSEARVVRGFNLTDVAE
jgi:tRNA pseudouridine55 synthase